jgi:hypothetical protein
MPSRLFLPNSYEAAGYKPRRPYSAKCVRFGRKRWLFAGKERTVSNVRKRQTLRAPPNWSIRVTTRSRRETVHFKHSFRIGGVDRLLPPGSYEVVTDEEMIEGLSFPCFRRVATLMMIPGAPPRNSTVEMISISSVDLSNAQREDASAPHE